MNIINSFWIPTSSDYDFTGADYIFSLRKLTGITTAFIQLIRSSDSQTAFVFFDGASSYSSINLNSYISTSSSTTPSTTTLTTWAGSDDVYVSTWINQITGFNASTNVISVTPASGGGLTDRPKLMTSGSFITKNGLPCIEFNGNDAFYQAAPYSEFDSTNSHTTIIVASNDSTTAQYALLHTGRTSANAFTIKMDSSAAATIAYAYGSTTTAEANYSSQNTTTNQRLLTVAKTSTLSAWYNGGVDSETGITWSGTYTNDEFYIGRTRNAAPQFLDGTMQEVIIYGSDQTSNRTSMETSINNYYSIY
jgi:hypothetical protein